METMNNFNAQTVFNFADLSKPVQKHLSAVYRTLALTILVSAIGAYAHLLYHIGGFLTHIGTIGCMIALFSSRDFQQRLGWLMGVGFCQGASVGPLINAALHTEGGPETVLVAFACTFAVFSCLSLCAMLSQRRSFLFLGGMLSSALSMLCMMSLFSLIFGITPLFGLQLYGGLLVFVGYVLFDTQVIIEKADRGYYDVVGDALSLFLDFVAIFVRILIILAKNNERKSKNNNRR